VIVAVGRDERLARAALSRICEPGTAAVALAVSEGGALAVLEELRADRRLPGMSAEALAGVRERLVGYDPLDDARCLDRSGARIVCPGDAEWPQDRLEFGFEQCGRGMAPPWALFVRGPHPLRALTERSVAVVGARAATTYGEHVAGELALGLADHGATVVSGGAYGIDAAAHRGALASGRTPTVAVLACGVDVAYPRGHDQLLTRIAEQGLVVSEWPLGCAPTRHRFLVRNRVIAAMSSGTVVVEAALRSGSLSTAARAANLDRPLMTVPGPVTSAQSAGCHALLRQGAICVTEAQHVLEAIGQIGEDVAPVPRGPEFPRDALSETVQRVLDAVPVHRPALEASIARAAGVSSLVVQQVLPPLLVAGLVQRSDTGWRLTALGAGGPARAVQ